MVYESVKEPEIFNLHSFQMAYYKASYHPRTISTSGFVCILQPELAHEEDFECLTPNVF